MFRMSLLLCLTLSMTLLVQRAACGDGPIRVLMMTGQSNHNWKATTPALREILNRGGGFALSIDYKPWEFGPDAFNTTDVVLSNWSVWPKIDADPWDDATKGAFLDFVEGGGGLVVVHAGSSIHYRWPAFQALVGKTWRKGKTWHGPRHEFLVTPVGGHPITRGVRPFRTFDELWRDMETTGQHETLARADTTGDKRKQGPAAPVLMTTRRGRGRAVNLVLGHDTRAMASQGFQTLLTRSLQWAANGAAAESAVTTTEPAGR